MKLTPHIIAQAPIYTNPEKKLTLNLRSLQILFIENLDATNNTFSVIDLTNNDIIEFSGIPELLDKLETVLLARNNISKVKKVHNHSITSLSLAHNNLTRLTQLVELRHLSLQHLVLIGNKVTREHNYRLFVVWLIPTLKVLDGEKVTLKERNEAKELFGESYETATPAFDATINGGASVPAPEQSKEERLTEATVSKLSKEEKEELLRQLDEAESLEEIQKIQAALKGNV